MYGSCKYKGQTYKLTKIYSFNVKSIKLEKYTKNISCILSTRKFTEEDEVPLRASTQSEDFKRRSKSNKRSAMLCAHSKIYMKFVKER